MFEINTSYRTSIKIPSEITEEWMSVFNNQYCSSSLDKVKYTATVTVEDWLEQPVGDIGSTYYSLHDQMGDNGWWQTISGFVHMLANTNVPHYSDTGFANVIALYEAKITRLDGSEQLLADGRLVLIRLDKIKDQLISIEQKQSKSYFLPGGDGNWDNLPMPETLKEAQERIKALQYALGFYSHGGAYDAERESDGIPSYSELMDDKGLVARIGRLAENSNQLTEWVAWARQQDRRW